MIHLGCLSLQNNHISYSTNATGLFNKGFQYLCLNQVKEAFFATTNSIDNLSFYFYYL